MTEAVVVHKHPLYSKERFNCDRDKYIRENKALDLFAGTLPCSINKDKIRFSIIREEVATLKRSTPLQK